MKTISLRAPVRQPRKVKSMTRAGNPAPSSNARFTSAVQFLPANASTSRANETPLWRALTFYSPVALWLK